MFLTLRAFGEQENQNRSVAGSQTPQTGSACGRADADAVTYRFVFVDEGGFKQHQPARMADLAASFTEYQD